MFRSWAEREGRCVWEMSRACVYSRFVLASVSAPEQSADRLINRPLPWEARPIVSIFAAFLAVEAPVLFAAKFLLSQSEVPCANTHFNFFNPMRM